MVPCKQALDELSRYFRLDMDAEPLYDRWTKPVDRMTEIVSRLRGMRIVRQDPVECLFSFICSSNNNITRIQGMVDKLKSTYGDLIYKSEVEDQEKSQQLFYAFPSVDTLVDKCKEEKLRALGFGYRAAFIVKSAKQLQELGGDSYLNKIRDGEIVQPKTKKLKSAKYGGGKSEVASDHAYQDALMVFAGVGRKVADCVALFSLEKLEAIPVDTHVWQIACRELDSSLNDRKSITPSVYLMVGDLFRKRFAPQAACAGGLHDACVLSPPANMVTLILSTATLVPVGACLVTAWLDARDIATGEQKPLLSTGDSTPSAKRPRRVITYLYASHLLSAWVLSGGDRIWGFAVPILFMDIFVDTLLPSAAFSLAMYIVCIFMIPTVGHHLDLWNRWTAMKYAILLENFMIVLNSVILVVILLLTNADGMHKPEWTWTLSLLFLGTLVCGGVGQVLNDAQTLGIERDWVVVIAGPDDSVTLANLNTTMRRIDLSCKILGPMAFGLIVDFAGTDATTRAMVGAAVVGLWNLISTPLEYYMTRDIYRLVPELAVRVSKEEVHVKGEKVSPTSNDAELGTLSRYAKMWGNYVKHPVFLVSFSFCALYMTILSGGALNVAYLKWRGVSNSLLGASQGAGALAGLVGTVVFPHLISGMKRVERVAVLSVWVFWLCLAPVLLAFLLAGESVVSDYLMLGCVVISRAWLWNTDLAETQIMQEWIAPNERGSINSMQTATCQFFFILILFAGVVFHDPRQFEALVVFSLAAVFASAVGFTFWEIKYGRKRDIYVPTRAPSPTKKETA
ncbi:hypothetical protein BBJ29_004269 [Phytophthora kernoviae]|uniref:HhH-GPD domain-containing protein n=1 Tax=Phytophthora kernoviae TaxID=325452 RepID=A0A3R7KHF3_9STRA|nr:hypothetical protein BBJ29_004269 [Phytophthora kernoviae]